jgi:hypothetical protein
MVEGSFANKLLWAGAHLQEASAQAELWTRLACFEGAQRAFAVVQAQYLKLELEPLAEKGPEKCSLEVQA